MKENRWEINERLARIIKKKKDLGKGSTRVGGEYTFQSSELSLLTCLGSHPGKSVTALAAILGITKGAVSQTLKKLEVKEMVLRDKDPTNASKAFLSLSIKGRTILQKHEDHHRVLQSGFNRYLERLSSRDVRVINDFLDQYESSLNN